ncbi:MAG: hypothetical protein J07HQX50_00726 [Haloquadratum sp. J07HQX50]|nr:MAG: hypothetical protein J07HQX50_00726 [Haloquadratum sp. J07HQX50]
MVVPNMTEYTTVEGQYSIPLRRQASGREGLLAFDRAERAGTHVRGHNWTATVKFERPTRKRPRD